MDNLSAEDVVTMAVKMEDNGETIYRRLAKRYEAEELGAVFGRLAEQELLHKSYFEGLLSTVKKDPGQIWFKPDLFEFLKIFAGDYLFIPGNMVGIGSQEFKTKGEALDFAMTSEKDAVLFYGELAKLAPENERVAIAKVIEQEKHHFVLLANEKNNLIKSGGK
ncbi:MAG: ferritin family protein [Candidatus Margulisbacteria bacterium]|nr:ferritin family protein [Candidatus Margulisiibacteriota bacterium]MBU1616579.1 ferritin family protein [Candidatus Margulisiibacteriota bacterium]